MHTLGENPDAPSLRLMTGSRAPADDACPWAGLREFRGGSRRLADAASRPMGGG